MRKASAWVLCLATVFLLAVGVWLLSIEPDLVADRVFLFAIYLTYATVGAIVVVRASGNRVGWALLAAGIVGALSSVSELYSPVASARDLPAAIPVALLSQATFFPSLILLVPVPALIFPDGRLPSRRWRWLVWVTACAIVMLGLGSVFEPGQLKALPNVPNPYGSSLFEGATIVNAVGLSAFVVTFLGAAAVIVTRFRSSRGEERQQLKWFSFAAVWAAIGLSTFIVLGTVSAEEGAVIPGWLELMVRIIPLVAILGLPISIGLAIVRYRLYEIDRLISRTIGYGIVVALLVGVYAGGVYLLGRLLPWEGGLAVAASTLAVAALFNPLRRRVQMAVDRRFYRSRYDAAQVVEEFTTQLQDNVELDVVTDDLVALVDETMRPDGVGVWVKDSG